MFISRARLDKIEKELTSLKMEIKRLETELLSETNIAISKRDPFQGKIHRIPIGKIIKELLGYLELEYRHVMEKDELIKKSQEKR